MQEPRRWSLYYARLNNQLKTPQGLIVILIGAAVVLFVLSLALGALGGAVGGSFFGRHDKS
jgi:cell division protein FtsX